MKAMLKKSQAQEPFSFTFTSDDGKALVKSENYTAKKSALNGIASGTLLTTASISWKQSPRKCSE